MRGRASNRPSRRLALRRRTARVYGPRRKHRHRRADVGGTVGGLRSAEGAAEIHDPRPKHRLRRAEGGGTSPVRSADGRQRCNARVHGKSVPPRRGLLSSTAVNNRRGYAGYEYDPTFEGAGRHLYHVRHRVYDADIGRWTRRDPLGYVDGTSLYEYVRSRAITTIDPMGQASASCASSCGGVPDPCAAERLNWLAAKAALASALSWLAGCFLVPPPGNFICAAAAGSAAIAADFAQRSACISLQACEMANAGTVFTFCDNGGVWPPGFTPPPPPPPYKRDPEWPTYPGPGGQCRI